MRPTLTAILAKEEHFDAFYGLRCQPDNVFWTGHSSAPERDRLRAWYTRSIREACRTFLLVELEAEIVGYLYIDLLEHGRYEISFGVSSAMSGKGIGREIVSCAERYALDNLPAAKTLTAWIAATNQRSIRCVQRNGFLASGQPRLGVLGGLPVQFHHYEKSISSAKPLRNTKP